MKQWPVVEKQLNSFTDINWSATLFTGHEQIIARKGFPWKIRVLVFLWSTVESSLRGLYYLFYLKASDIEVGRKYEEHFVTLIRSSLHLTSWEPRQIWLVDRSLKLPWSCC